MVGGAGHRYAGSRTL